MTTLAIPPALAAVLTPDGQHCTLTAAQARRLSRKTRDALEAEAGRLLRQFQRESQLEEYRPINADARRVHLSTAWEIGVSGGNKSGKTGAMLAEMAIQMTGIVPDALAADYPRVKLRAPIRVRLVVSSLANAWDINLKQKLQWWAWNGRENADRLDGDPRLGHFGLIPRRFLLGGDWDKSWSEKHRILTLNAKGDSGAEPGSTLQVMSWEQAIPDFNQGAYHLIVSDEVPPEEVHRANRIRTMELGGRLLIGGTPPDTEVTGVTAAWFFDQVITPGLDGSNPERSFAITLWTEHNPTIDPKDRERSLEGLTPAQRLAREHGESLHLTGLIYPGFREKPATWCFTCHESVRTTEGACLGCGGTALGRYTHVWDDGDVDPDVLARWPVVFYMDPHQSRPTACAWVAVDRMDQWWQVAELDVPGGAEAVTAAVEGLERARGWVPVWRKGDPKITAQANQFAREIDGEVFNIRRAFAEVGFDFEPAGTNFTVGRERVLQAMAVNPLTRAPRLRVHRSCVKTIYSMTHFTWESPRRDGTPTAKDQPARRHSDFPALIRYLAIDDPEHRQLERVQAPQVIHGGTWRIGGGR